MMCRCCMSQRKYKQKYYRGRSIPEIASIGLAFDFNDSDMLFEAEFCEQCTNDAGEVFLPQTTQILVGEFRKYFVSLVISLLEYEKDKLEHKHISSQIDGIKTYTVGNRNPIYFARIWKALILHNHSRYRKLCDTLCAYIDRKHAEEVKDFPSSSNLSDIFKYQEICNFFAVHKSSAMNFDERYYEVLLTPEQLEAAKELISQKVETFEVNKTIAVDEVAQLTQSINFQEEIGIFHKSEFANEPLISDTEMFDSKVKSVFLKLLNMDLPQSLLKSFCSKLLLSEEQAVIVLVEYIKFLILKSIDSECVPSFLIDQFWRKQIKSFLL